MCVGYCLIDFVLYQRYRMKTKRCCRETDIEIKKYAVFMYYAKVFIIRALFYHFRRDIRMFDDYSMQIDVKQN